MGHAILISAIIGGVVLWVLCVVVSSYVAFRIGIARINKTVSTVSRSSELNIKVNVDSAVAKRELEILEERIGILLNKAVEYNQATGAAPIGASVVGGPVVNATGPHAAG